MTLGTFRTIVNLWIGGQVFKIHLPLMLPSEQKSLVDALTARPDEEDKLDLMIAVRDFHFLDVPGPIQ